jgi:hypothetical protein
MNHNRSVTPSHNGIDEVRFFTRAVSTLAMVTAVLYMRAIVVGGFLSSSAGALVPMRWALFGLLLFGVVGLLIGWRWEGPGGAIALLAAVAITIVTFLTFVDIRLLATFVYASPFYIAGGLLLADWRKHRP